MRESTIIDVYYFGIRAWVNRLIESFASGILNKSTDLKYLSTLVFFWLNHNLRIYSSKIVHSYPGEIHSENYTSLLSVSELHVLRCMYLHWIRGKSS